MVLADRKWTTRGSVGNVDGGIGNTGWVREQPEN